MAMIKKIIKKIDNREGQIDLREEKLINWILSALSVLAVSSYMPIFMFSVNSKEASFSDILFPLKLFSLISIFMLALMVVFTKSISKAAIIAMLTTIVLENYRFIESGIVKIFTSLKYWHILPICMVVVLHIGYLLYYILKEETAKIFSYIIGGVSLLLIIFNLFTAIPNMVPRSNYRQNSGDVSTVNGFGNEISENDGANIYYFVLDEAAAFNTLEKYYDYEAIEFKDFLRKYNFTISYNSHNDCINTKTVMTNLLNLDYPMIYGHGDGEGLLDNPPLVQVLNRNKYKIIGVGDTQWLNIDSVTSEEVSGATSINGQTFIQVIMSNTFIYPWYKKEINDSRKRIMGTFNYFTNKEIYNTSNEFKLIYICAPHQPFVFDENGRDVMEEHAADWEDEKYYLGQYKFVIKKLMESIKKIIEYDPHSIIVISSDHGPRYNPEMPKLMPEELPDMTNILSAVYFKGESIDEIIDQSSVNTLRAILSKQFKENLPAVEVKYSDFLY